MSQAETITGLGARTDYVATVPNADPAQLGLSPEESAVFACVGRVARIEDVLARSGMAEPKTIAVLLSLRAKGAIVPARYQKNEPPGRVDAAMSEQVDLDPARKKEILDLEHALDKLSHFETLGLLPGATVEEVRTAYREAARRYHPDRYYGKNLGSFRARIEHIFKRSTEAMNVLTDPTRREAYLKAHPEWADVKPAVPAEEASAIPLDPVRDAERRARLARHPYLSRGSRLSELVTRGKKHVAAGDFAKAYTDLHMAGQADPTNREIQQLLQEVRRKHDEVRATDEMKKGDERELVSDLTAAVGFYRSAANIDPKNVRAAFKTAQLMLKLGMDIREAKPFAQRAVDLDPNQADHHVVLGTILVEGGMKKLAKRHLEQALELKPEHPEAKKQLSKVRWTF